MQRAAKVVAAPAVSPELVIRFKKGQLQSNLVLRVQDTGGQPIFLTILELLTTPEGTVYMVVFSLAKLQEDFAATLETTSAQLKSIQVFAAGAPIILAGTRRDEVKGGEAELTKLSDKLLDGLQQQCAPAIAGLERDPATGRCFFGIENSKGYQGDATIRNLVKAVEAAAYKLPSMRQRVPLEWLRVHDELRKVGQVQRRVRLDAVRAIATKHGLPHTGFTLDEELSGMLTFFHSLNSILWCAYTADALSRACCSKTLPTAPLHYAIMAVGTTRRACATWWCSTRSGSSMRSRASSAISSWRTTPRATVRTRSIRRPSARSQRRGRCSPKARQRCSASCSTSSGLEKTSRSTSPCCWT